MAGVGQRPGIARHNYAPLSEPGHQGGDSAGNDANYIDVWMEMKSWPTTLWCLIHGTHVTCNYLEVDSRENLRWALYSVCQNV